MIQVGMIYTWEEKEKLSQYVNVCCPSSVTHQFIPCLRTSQVKCYLWKWLINTVYYARSKTVHKCILPWLFTISYLPRAQIPGRKKKYKFLMYKVLDFILFTYLFSVLEIKPRPSGTPEKYFTIEPHPQFKNLNYDNKTH